MTERLVYAYYNSKSGPERLYVAQKSKEQHSSFVIDRSAYGEEQFGRSHVMNRPIKNQQDFLDKVVQLMFPSCSHELDTD